MSCGEKLSHLEDKMLRVIKSMRNGTMRGIDFAFLSLNPALLPDIAVLIRIACVLVVLLCTASNHVDCSKSGAALTERLPVLRFEP